MGVHVHRSERTDVLLRGLAQLLTETPTDPFTPEIVAVPTPGIERFITQGLGLVLGTSRERTDGVCANVDFPSPAAVTNRVVAQATGVDPGTDPWLPQRAVWALLSVIDQSAGLSWCEPLARHLGLLDHDPLRRDRRFAVASRIAGLFAAYASQRPDMVLAWAGGDDTDVPGDLAWQPPLWRALRDEIGTRSLAERLDEACRAVASDPAVVDLPDRLSVFGASRLPVDQLQVLAALGTHREVHLWLADASPDLWSRVTPNPSQHRRDDVSAAQVANPLLRSLGRDAREMHMKLTARCPVASDEHVPTDMSGAGLLQHLQRQIRDNQLPLSIPVQNDDHTLQVHACHGQARQAEVVREVLLGLLQSDPTLEPRDILVMCPDLDTFAPLMSAAFSGPEPSLRVRIADRTPEQSNDVLGALAALLDLAERRAELSTLLDFAALPPVRAKFGFDDAALERLEGLTTTAGIRWGLDEQQRHEYQVRLASGTWTWGVDRLLLGATMSEEGLALLNGVLPVDDVNSGDVELVGRLAELVTRVRRVREAVLVDHPGSEWVSILTHALTDLTETRGPDAWQLPNALGTVASLVESGRDYSDAVTLSLADLRWLLHDSLAGRPTRSNFRSGDLTVCGLMPMRSVPHRVVCLVGMDDGVFPRSNRIDGDDITGRDPLVGERDLRSEDRQVLLDAIMAAQDALVITYTGADERTNEPQPPCVPLGDLLDTVDAMTDAGGRSRVLVQHPLQPFDVRNFTSGALGAPGPFSHDVAALDAARRSLAPRTPRPSMRMPDLAEGALTDVSPQELGKFLTSPAAAFLRTKLGLSLRSDDEGAPEQIPVELSGLEKWQIGDRALPYLADGLPEVTVAAAERARGQLPPGGLGTKILRDVGHDAVAVAQRVAALRIGAPAIVSVSVDLPNGVRVVGAVPDIYGEAIVRATYSKMKAKSEVQIWPELLALAASEPHVRRRARYVAKDKDFTLTAPPADEAQRILTELVEIYLAGQRSPLPIPPATARDYTQRRTRGTPAHVAAQLAENGPWKKDHESTSPEVALVWGPAPTLAALLEEHPRKDENWYDEDTRFGMLARRVWEPILRARETP
ncbi:MAG: exodeoxyribonuclease V subunit gamma [Candidatus Nanopelagicales bacterium]|nr:exodeoxyribonuclease V subunit gamma [Candidatus Nanopelagicales bacterium]